MHDFEILGTLYQLLYLKLFPKKGKFNGGLLRFYL